MRRSAFALSGLLALAALVPAHPAHAVETSPAEPRPAARRDYSFGYWLNGWRKSPQDASADVLGVETGYFGFQLDVDDLVNARFGLVDDDLDYGQALEAGAQRLRSQPSAKLAIEIQLARRQPVERSELF